MIKGTMREVVLLSVTDYNFFVKRLEAWMLSGVSEVPLLLRGAFDARPSATEWADLIKKVVTARTQIRALKSYSYRRDYMRDYMRQRRAKGAVENDPVHSLP